MRRLRLIGALAGATLFLQACDYGAIASAGSAAVSILPLLAARHAPPANGMSKEIYQDTNALYVSTGKRIVAAVSNGKIASPSAADEPDTIRSEPDFCKLAIAGLAQVHSPGGELKRLDCLANQAVADMEGALGRNDPTSFVAAKGRAKEALSDMDRIISEAEKGTSP